MVLEREISCSFHPSKLGKSRSDHPYFSPFPNNLLQLVIIIAYVCDAMKQQKGTYKSLLGFPTEEA